MLLTACGGTAGSQAQGATASPPVPAPTSSTAAASPPSTTPTPVATPESSPTGVNIDGCVTEKNGTIFKYKRGGTTTQGVIMGKGPVGVVVSYERRGSVCGWLPLADRMVDAGYRVLLFDRNNEAEPEGDIVAMATRLRAAGVKKVFLVGGSVGGQASVLAAGKLTSPPAGVISISGVTQPGEVATLKAPFLQVDGDQDDIAPVDLAQAVYDAATESADRQLVILPGREHASGLFTGDQAPKLFRAVLTFLDKHKG
ncbi:hypothetical protein FHR32_002364 [Streptosporangium album]|uniref:Alpha/beta hydrolase n=1 Tax=Streptosporangium album TaxID=47479 RepID=A0A7W7RTR3_9ACTN|nr:hypothetical protein [Streptosporangium album]MBB4938059.1 hypothetical protein [Streptosporangium album]